MGILQSTNTLLLILKKTHCSTDVVVLILRPGGSSPHTRMCLWGRATDPMPQRHGLDRQPFLISGTAMVFHQRHSVWHFLILYFGQPTVGHIRLFCEWHVDLYTIWKEEVFLKVSSIASCRSLSGSCSGSVILKNSSLFILSCQVLHKGLCCLPQWHCVWWLKNQQNTWIY